MIDFIPRDLPLLATNLVWFGWALPIFILYYGIRNTVDKEGAALVNGIWSRALCTVIFQGYYLTRRHAISNDIQVVADFLSANTGWLALLIPLIFYGSINHVKSYMQNVFGDIWLYVCAGYTSLLIVLAVLLV